MNHKLLIIGAGWAGQTIAEVLAKKKPEQIIGFVEDKPTGESVVIPDGNGGITYPIVGQCKNLSDLIKQYQAKAIVTAITHERGSDLLAELVKCYEAEIPVYEMPELYLKLTKKIPVQHVHQQWIIPKLTAPEHGVYPFFHDLMNFLFGFIGLLFLFFPLFPLISFLIKLDSSGPIFIKQVRVGKKEKQFTLYKFRTMTADAEKEGKAVWASPKDHRVTRVGKWLRKFRLDELPQFINVLKGEMSLIGPRPERPEFVEKLVQEIPFYNYRHLVKPGITGWAQVSYKYGNSVSDALEKLQFDLYWIKKRSFLLDVKIILKSIRVVLTGFGAH